MISRTCRVSGKKFEITESDLYFYAKMEVITETERDQLKSREISDCVGLPTLCPEERNSRRLLFRNDRNIYWRKCSGTGNKTLSIYSPDKSFIIYEPSYWYSDKWDPQKYAQDFDFSRPFFEQFHELLSVVPRIATITVGNENADFVNYAGWNKNCYLIFNSDKNHDCAFIVHSFGNVSSFDSFYINGGGLCYECVTSLGGYDCRFCQDCKNCTESWFLKNCIGCANCFGCVNLRNKQYYFLNKAYSKEEYFKKLENLQLQKYSNLKNMREKFIEFVKQFPQKSYQGTQNEDVSGDYINNSKNTQNCFNIENCKDSAYLIDCLKCNNCYDIDEWGGSGAEFCYEGNDVGEGANNIKFCVNVWESVNDIEYSDMCIKGSNHLFGCVGLRHKQYCILNKQYTKEEYFKTREKIIEHMKNTGEWGEFFPIELSPFGYNETVAQEYFPLTKEEARKRGHSWKDKISRDFRPATIQNIPDDIADVDDSICKEILACENILNSPLTRGAAGGFEEKKCGKNYQIQKAELRFYRKINLPIPRKCPDCRHADRMKLRNPRTLFARNCGDCQIDIQTTFSPDRPEKVLCEKCYLKVVD